MALRKLRTPKARPNVSASEAKKLARAYRKMLAAQGLLCKKTKLRSKLRASEAFCPKTFARVQAYKNLLHQIKSGTVAREDEDISSPIGYFAPTTEADDLPTIHDINRNLERIQMSQISDLKNKFSTARELALACGCTLDDLVEWETLHDPITNPETEDGRMAGQLPRWAEANLFRYARYYGVYVPSKKDEI